MGRSPHANPAIGAFGGAPYGATKRVRGVPKWVRCAGDDDDDDEDDVNVDDDDGDD